MTSKVFRPRNFLVIIMLLVLAAVAYGFAATNTVADSSAGDGAGDVSGYDVSSIHYELDTSDPTDIDAVEFTLTGTTAPQTVYIQLDSYSGWFTCTMSGSDATCDTSGQTVPVGSTFTELRVVAAQ
jgi:hypothetical protein